MPKSMNMKVWVMAVALLALAGQVRAQLSNPISNRVINYKTVFDDPYDINQLWIGISPLSAYVSGTNMALGFSLTTRIMLGSKAQINGVYQGSYGKGLDQVRFLAEKNGGINYRSGLERRDRTIAQNNNFVPFTHLELGGQYAIADREVKGTSKIMLTSKKARVMEFTNVDYVVVNSKTRHIWAARAGAKLFGSAVILNPAMKKQNLSLKATDGTTLMPNGSTVSADGATSRGTGNQLFSNLQYIGAYVGGSYTRINNVTIKADKFGNLANNVAFTAYSDFIVAPKPILTEVQLESATGPTNKVDVSGLKVNKLGFRTGFDIFYNQDLHYSVGAEVGYAPGLRNQRLYMMARFSFPTFSFKIKRNRLSNQMN